jgi:hypothetical protein
VGESSEKRESSDNVEYYQLLIDYHKVQADWSSARLNAEMLRADVDAAHNALHFSMTEVFKARVDWDIHMEQGQNMMNLLVDLRTQIKTLVLCVQAVDNLFAT